MITIDRENRTCLHLVVRSSIDALESCRSRFDAGDAVLFLDDGVMHVAENPGRIFQPLYRNGFFSDTDLNARGLRTLAGEAGVRIISDPEFVDLLQKHDFCLTWK